MAWWTDILFLKRHLEESQGRESGSGLFARFLCAIRRVLYDNFVDTLHHLLFVATYSYLAANIAVFFFQSSMPRTFTTLVETFSEPYLGALGIYVVVNEIRRRRGRKVYPHFSSVFTALWIVLLTVSTALVYFGDTFYFNAVYRTIVTNSFAAFIIRLGTVLGKMPP